MRKKVLFICVHNSARSRMAETFCNELCGDCFEAQSAGLDPGTVNPLAAKVMAEVGLDITEKAGQNVFEVYKSGQLFPFVITVCSESESEACPIFPGPARRLHWPFPDPSKVQGSEEEKCAQVRSIRDQIRDRVERWCKEVCPDSATMSERR